jgi:hypothetical protein
MRTLLAEQLTHSLDQVLRRASDLLFSWINLRFEEILQQIGRKTPDILKMPLPLRAELANFMRAFFSLAF